MVGDRGAESCEEEDLASRFPVGDPQHRHADDQGEGQYVRGAGCEALGATVQVEEQEQAEEERGEGHRLEEVLAPAFRLAGALVRVAVGLAPDEELDRARQRGEETESQQAERQDSQCTPQAVDAERRQQPLQHHAQYWW
ncbi:MAG: hypothetical protein OXU63_09655 [Acidobacteriota bacterium]|nr:hypothetical protein [Acidobacteriota bacterium]